MRRKLALPIADSTADAPAPPTLEGMRQKLGGRLTGRSSSDIELGSLVVVPTSSEGARLGVLLADDAGTVDVYLARGIVKRTLPSSLCLHLGTIPLDLERVAEEARVFGALAEGQRVHVEQAPLDGIEAIIREKCRYGALVEATSGAVFAVGFRKLWPCPSEPHPS